MSAADLDPPPVTAARRRGLRWRIPGFSALPDDTFDAPTLDPTMLAERRDRTAADAFVPLTVALGVMLLLSSVFRLPAEQTPGAATSAVIAAVACGITGAGLILAAMFAGRRTATRNPHAAALAVVLVATVALCVAMLATGSLAQTAYVQLIVVVAGPTILRTAWYLVGLAAVWSLWLGTTAALSGTTDAGGWFLAMLAATVLSVVLHTMRTDSIKVLGAAVVNAEAQAVRDPLTGLLNRRGLAMVGAEVQALCRRSREPLSCTFVDVDGLKAVNDSAGHESGDQVLIEVAEALLAVFRQADIVARWGGDEFVVVAMGAGPRIEDVERRLEQRLNATAVATSGVWQPSLSCGRIVHMPWQEESLDDITERADEEMYRRRRLRRAQAVGEDSA